MYILSQDGLFLVQADNLRIEKHPFDEGSIFGVSKVIPGEHCQLVLGEYKTIEKARKQLSNIAQRVGQGATIYQMEKDDA